MVAYVSGMVLINATLASGEVTHLRIEGDTVVDVGEHIIADAGDELVDLSDHVVLPAAVEPHAHLDKAFLAERIDNQTGDLLGAITAMQGSRHLLDVPDTIERAERAARLMAANGYVAVRTHADTILEHGLRSIEALREVRQRVADEIDIEIVALCGWPVTGPAGADQRALLRDALARGADLVGGAPHLDDDTRAATEVLLEIADDAGVGVDLHTDETLDPEICGLTDLAHAVLDGFPHPVTASHCVSLGQQSLERQREIAELVAEAGVAIVALPHTNLYLQGRGRCPVPRGLTAVEHLRAAGVSVAAGADNLQDPFNPLGRACPFETAGLMVLAAHLLPGDAWASVSTSAAAVLGRPPAGPIAGAHADLLAVPAATTREAIAMAPPRRLRWRAGVLSDQRILERTREP
jgi:cytosine/creatinine deaminase